MHDYRNDRSCYRTSRFATIYNPLDPSEEIVPTDPPEEIPEKVEEPPTEMEESKEQPAPEPETVPKRAGAILTVRKQFLEKQNILPNESCWRMSLRRIV